MNRKINNALKRVDQMREKFAGSVHEADINEIADRYVKLLTSNNGISDFTLNTIKANLASLGC